MRAAYGALIIGLIGGLWLATTVLSTTVARPRTVAEALALDPGGSELDGRRATAVAVLTAACMRQLGFDWRPVPEPPPDVPDAELDPVAWADRWGFGVTTIRDRPPTSAPDPNLDALAEAPAGIQARLRAALFGQERRPGCQQTARDAVYGLRDRLLQPMRHELDALADAVAADPALGLVLASWQGCVAPISGGLTIDRRTLPRALIERFRARVAGSSSGSDVLNDLQRDERTVAGTLARCETDYVASRARVAARYEAAFLTTHGATLAQLGAAIRAAEAALPTMPP